MIYCPICNASAGTTKQRGTPYHECPNCRVWFQHPFPEKVWHGPHEGNYDSMSDAEKNANKVLARWLNDTYLTDIERPRTLDIGAGYPWLAHCFGLLRCDAIALDGEVHNFPGQRCEYIECNAELLIRAGHDLLPFAQKKFDLVTLVHTFEHLYDPVSLLNNLPLGEGGLVFIRMPDRDVKGYERDLTDGHYKIHPYYHCIDSVLECCLRSGVYRLIWTSTLEPGQRDIVLRRTDKPAPTLGIAMIVKNEARDLPRALNSLTADYLHITDTGSTDGTVALAKKYGASVDTYLSASEEVNVGSAIGGGWQLWDFAKARNHSLEMIEAQKPDWIMWFDADDELLSPGAIRHALYREDVDVFGMTVDAGQRWTHHRLWRASAKVRFNGRCHEYAVIDGLRAAMLNAVIRHHGEPTEGQETSNARNLRILTRAWDEDGPDSRTAFYLANTHRDGARWEDAVTWYRKRIDMGAAFVDEYAFACLYGARCLVELHKFEEALAMLRTGEAAAPGWCELLMEIAYCRRHLGQVSDAMVIASKCVGAAIPSTPLWREPDKYGVSPCMLMALCYEEQGNITMASAWATKAMRYSDAPDVRERAMALAEQLSVRSPAVLTGKRERIILQRPGAIGDILMTLNLLPAFKRAHPDADVFYACHPHLAKEDELGWIIRAAGAIPVGIGPTGVTSAINMIGYPLQEGYPHKPMRQHLLQYFAAEMGLGSDMLPVLELPLPLMWCTGQESGSYITVQKEAGWSKYKEWRGGWKNVSFPLPTVFIGKDEGRTLRQSITLIANARLHVGMDSFGNHVTNYLWRSERSAHKVPGVIVWGSTQWSAAGYPHNTNLSVSLPCQPCFRENPAISIMPVGPCINPPRQTYEDDASWACMKAITAEQITAAIMRKLELTRGSYDGK